jgi:hypothetical protein
MYSFTVVLLFSLCAVLVVFSQDIYDQLKKLFGKKWVTVFVPILIASFLVAYFESDILFILHHIKWALYQAISFFVSVLPFQWGAWLLIATPIIMILTFLAPMLIKITKQRTSVIPVTYLGFMTALIWIFVVILFATSMHG